VKLKTKELFKLNKWLAQAMSDKWEIMRDRATYESIISETHNFCEPFTKMLKLVSEEAKKVCSPCETWVSSNTLDSLLLKTGVLNE
jgi:hypothetical protein